MPFIQRVIFVSIILGCPMRVDAIMNLSLSEIGIATALSSDSSEVALAVAGSTGTGRSSEVAIAVAGGSEVDSCRRGRVPSFYMRVRIGAIATQMSIKRGVRSYHFSFLWGWLLQVRESTVLLHAC